MKKQKWISAFIALFLFLGGCFNGEYAAEKLYWKATKKYNYLLTHLEKAKALDFHKVVMAYRQLIAKYPDWSNVPRAYFNISQLYVLQKEYDQARQEMEKIKEEFPEALDVCASAEFTIAMIYEEEEKWDKALEYLERTEKAYPYTYSALLAPLHIARHYKMKEEIDKEREAYQQAIAKYKAMIEEKPDTRGALAVLDFVITAYAEQDKKNEILVYLEELTEKYPASALKAKALFTEGLIYYNLGEKDTAIDILKRIIMDFPDTNLAVMAQEQIEKIKKESNEDRN